MLRIRQVNEQQINAALNDIDKSIGSMQTEAASVKKSVAEENKNTQKVIEGLSKRLDNKLSDLDSAIGNNIEYINNHFVPNTRTVNGKSLSNNIELTASDVGAATVNDITNAINGLDVASAGGAGKYISEISESNGKISATATTMDTTPTANSTNAVTSGGIKSAIDTAESNAKNLANATGTLPVANGGTGATTAGGACTNLIGALTVANGDVTDNTDVITSNADGYAEQSDKQFYKRKGIKFWNYIKSKISSVLGLSTTGLSTGTITTTGDIHVGKGKSIIADGTKANYSMIKFKDNTGDEYGNGVVIGGGGAVVIGGGESADAYYSGASLSAGSETMAVTNDGDITFVSNLQNGYANRKTMTMGTDGKLTNSQGFVGPLTGNVTGNVSGSAGSCAEANLTWGGRNFAGTYGALDAALVSELGANRYAGINTNGVTIEYSRDGGSTWTAYGATAQNIKRFFTNFATGFIIGKADSANRATANGTRYQLRITVDHANASVYTEIKKYVIYVSTNGSASCTVDIQRALKQSPDSWANYMTGIPLSGWSGFNVIQTSFTAGNSFDNQFRKVRFIFKANGGDTNYLGLNVISIFAYGGVGWTTPSTLAKTGHLYSIDVNGSGNLVATFPNLVNCDISGNSASADYTRGTALCTTAGGTAAKVASMRGFALPNPITTTLCFPITFTETNAAASELTLNINGTGAKKIYINGAVSSSSNYVIPAGTYLCEFYNDVYYIEKTWCVHEARDCYTLNGISGMKWLFGLSTSEYRYDSVRGNQQDSSTATWAGWRTFYSGLKIAWGHYRTSDSNPVTLPVTYTSKETYSVAVTFVLDSNGKPNYEEFLKPYSTTQIKHTGGNYEQYWITIGY